MEKEHGKMRKKHNIQEEWEHILKKKKIEAAMHLSKETYEMFHQIQFKNTYLLGISFRFGKKKYKLEPYVHKWLVEVKRNSPRRELSVFFNIKENEAEFLSYLFQEMNLFQCIAENENFTEDIDYEETKWDQILLHSSILTKIAKPYFKLVQISLILLYIPVVIIAFFSQGKLFENRFSEACILFLSPIITPLVKYFERTQYMLDKMEE